MWLRAGYRLISFAVRQLITSQNHLIKQRYKDQKSGRLRHEITGAFLLSLNGMLLKSCQVVNPGTQLLF